MGIKHMAFGRSKKAVEMCDSFLGEGGGRGLIGYSSTRQIVACRNPSLRLRAFQPHPSRWEGIEKPSNIQGIKLHQ
jgi:hypothetical protein